MMSDGQGFSRHPQLLHTFSQLLRTFSQLVREERAKGVRGEDFSGGNQETTLSGSARLGRWNQRRNGMIQHRESIVELEDSKELVRTCAQDVIIELLRDQALFNLELDRFTTPLHLAMTIQQEELQRDVVAELLSQSTVLGTVNHEKNTALHLAVANGATAVVTQLLAAGAPVNAAGNKCQSPLHVAISIKDVEVAMTVIRALLAAGADIWWSDQDGNTALHLAIARGAGAIIMQLFHAEVGVECAHKHPSLLHMAISITEPKVARHVVSVLLAAGADVRARDKQQNTALHIAVATGSCEIITQLLLSSAPINEAGKKHKYPLHIATTMQDERLAFHTVSKLLREGAIVGVKDGDLNTALHLAIEQGRSELVRLLIEKKADVNVPGKTGTTPHGAAMRLSPRGIREVITGMLEAAGAVRVLRLSLAGAEMRTGFGFTSDINGPF